MSRFPLDKVAIHITADSDSYKNRDFSRETEIPIEPHCGAFGAVRKFDIHTGVDLYANPGDSVYAIEKGIVVCIEHFTGTQALSPWWADTMAVHIEGVSGVIVYGEIEPLVEITEGISVQEGQKLGTVKRVLKKDKGRPTAMLHIELYKQGSRQTCIWDIDKSQNTNLLNPTDILINIIDNCNIV